MPPAKRNAAKSTKPTKATGTKPAAKSATKSAKSAAKQGASAKGASAKGPDDRDPVQRHRWVVDVVEEDSVAIEVDGRSVTSMPRWMLPAGARQGDVLAVTHRREDARSVLTIEIDRAGTRAAYSASASQVEQGRAASSLRDAGGDIAL